MELKKKLCASSLRSGAGGTCREFLDALAPRRAVKARKKPARWQDDRFGC